MKQFDKNDRPKMLVFMTDGLPTVGETNIDKINSNLQKAKTVDVRIFPFGFGYDVNTALLDKLGSENSGHLGLRPAQGRPRGKGVELFREGQLTGIIGS